MKKIYLYIVLAVLLFIPIGVKAEAGISKFYADATINEDGSVLVKEIFTMTGEYNGFNRILKYANGDALKFNPNDNKYGGSDLHNGSNIIVNKVMGVNNGFFDDQDFENINGDLFKIGMAQSYGYYLESEKVNGKDLRIYNPSNTGKAFYVEYIISNLAILHNDVGEIGWNIFGSELTESIDEFKMTIHLPNNKKELRAWAHGPLNGNIKIIDKNTVKVTIDELSKETAFDVRLAFDKEIISKSIKSSNVNALDKIINYEQEKASEANSERNKARLLYWGSISIAGLWSIGLVGILIYAYLKWDKEYRSNFNMPYYREFPNTYGPEIVGYLFNKKISTNDLSAAILNLIYKKVIKVEEIPGDKKKKYKFIFDRKDFSDVNDLNMQEQKLISWLFDNQKEIELDEFQKKAKSGYESFLNSYTDWKNLAIKEAVSYNFYEPNKCVFAIVFALFGMIACFFLGTMVDEPKLMYIPLLFGGGAIIYLSTMTKRSRNGNEEYVKWRAFKKFLIDFGNFKEKELPEIVLWEKYLVYAVTLGCADKLAKTMEIKARELYPNGMPSGYYYHHDFYYYVALNRVINTGVNRAVNNAVSTKTAAQSSNSSGSGFGGGFSSGGGSFGGGGGGGRF